MWCITVSFKDLKDFNIKFPLNKIPRTQKNITLKVWYLKDGSKNHEKLHRWMIWMVGEEVISIPAARRMGGSPEKWQIKFDVRVHEAWCVGSMALYERLFWTSRYNVSGVWLRKNSRKRCFFGGNSRSFNFCLKLSPFQTVSGYLQTLMLIPFFHLIMSSLWSSMGGGGLTLKLILVLFSKIHAFMATCTILIYEM